MKWIKSVFHFPSFFSYRIPNYSSQYALCVPLPSPSTIKLGIVATALRITGNVAEGERVFEAVKNADVRIIPPKQIAINSVLIKRLKKRGIKNKIDKEKYEKGLLPVFETTFGIREYAFFPDDLQVFIHCENSNLIKKYVKFLSYVGSSDSLLYVRSTKLLNEPPTNTIKAITSDEFPKYANKGSSIVFPVKDISKNAKFEQINPYSNKPSKKEVFETKYYLVKAQIQRGKNWKILKIQT